MTGEAELAAAFSAARGRLVRVAYAVLGSHAEAEDVVADCWLRLVNADRREPIRDVDAWATVAVARGALDTLRSARVRREVYVGPWLPEPVVEELAEDPAERVTLDERISFALLVVLETLTPAERTAWVLHDLFGMPFDQISEVVGRTPAAVRQLASRARTHVQSQTPRFPVTPAGHSATVSTFLQATVGGDLKALIEALDPDVVLTSDGGGVVSAARRPIYGADRVARFLYGIAAKVASRGWLKIVGVNGSPGLGLFEGDDLTGVVSFTLADDRIVRLDLVMAPAKLPRVG